MQISKLDIVIIGYLLYGSISGFIISELPLNSYLFVKWFALIAVYLCTRMLPQKWQFGLLLSIIGVGVAQSIIAIAQQFGYVESNHSMFPITGLLGNPGQLGGFQAISFVLSVAVAVHIKRIRYYIIPIIVLLGYSVVIADSRAGWLAVAIGLITLFYKEIFLLVKNHKIVLPLIVVVVIIAGAVLYNYRSESADSRLLIWRVCADMIADKPILGHGVGSFNEHYMLYQVDYFEENPDSRFVMVADNVAYPYNEFLHVWIEQGVIGVILFVLLFGVSLCSAPSMVRCGLATLLTFSMFSYPSYVYALLVLFPILLALSAPINIRSKSFAFCYLSCVSLLITSSVITYYEMKFIEDSKYHIAKLIAGDSSTSMHFFSTNYNRIMQYHQLNVLTPLILLKHPELATKARIIEVVPTCENWCDIGLIYYHNNEYEVAEAYFSKAANMVPSRFKPKYYLWRMYAQTDQTQKAIAVAKKLLSQKLKIENTFSLRSKAELREFLSKVGI